MYGEQHLLAYKSQEESKVVYGLSMRQLGWWIAGGVATMKLCTYIPPIPIGGYFGYAFHFTPLLIALSFAHIKHPTTGLSLASFVISWFKCRRRKRMFV